MLGISVPLSRSNIYGGRVLTDGIADHVLLTNLTSDPVSHVPNGSFMLANSQNDEAMPDRMGANSNGVQPMCQFVIRDESFGDVCRIEDES
jgi:hypothetical protein